MYVLTEVANIVPDTDDQVLDEIIVARINAGETGQFALIYQRYRARTFALAYGMTGHRDQAEDLAQEIFLRAYQRLPTFKGQAKFATWFYRLALNHCLNYCRHERSRKRPLTNGEPNLPKLIEVRTANETHDTVLRREIQQQIRMALLSLKPEMRLLLIMKDIEDLSYEEIAERLDCSTGTVGSRLNRARKLLARKLEGLKGKI